MTEKSDEEAGGVLENLPPDEDHVVIDDGTNLQYDSVSNSSITGEFTTITNVLDGHADGAGNQFYSPSRSTFEVVDIIDGYSMPRTASAPNSIDGSNLGSYDSYYHMQKNGPPIVPESESHVRNHSIMRYGWRGGGMSGLTGSSLADTMEKDEGIEIERFREDASESNTNDRASSLSSLTNDFFPKIDRRGRRFFSSPMRDTRPSLVEAQQGSISPTSSNDKSSSQSSKMFQKVLTPPRIKRNNLVHDSPWYVNKHHRDTSTPSPQNSSDQTPMNGHLPGEVLLTPSPKVSDSNPSNPTPSVISSSNMSQYFSNELREIYNSNVYRSYRHHYDEALSSPKAKRIMISSVILAALFAIVAIVAISLGARPQNHSVIEVSTSSYYDTQRNGDEVLLPEKCCVGKLDDEGLIETDVQDQIDFPTGDNSKAPSPSESPIQYTPPTNFELDWDYVTILTPQPTPGAGEDSETAAIPITPNPTPVEDSSGWKPSILPSWIQPDEKQMPIVTSNPTRRPTRRPTRNPTRNPTRKPTRKPTKQPTTKNPTRFPTHQPTSTLPTSNPTNASVVTSAPTKVPTSNPATVLTPSPSSASSNSPVTILPTTPKPVTPQPSTVSGSTPNPTLSSTTQSPTASPSAKPSPSPTSVSTPQSSTLPPTSEPSPNPTSVSTPRSSTVTPTHKPTPNPTVPASLKPTVSPVTVTSKTIAPQTDPPTIKPTPKPMPNPTDVPVTDPPTNKPTPTPMNPPATDKPTKEPTHKPSPGPTNPPPATDKPTPKPNPKPTPNPVFCPGYPSCTTIDSQKVCCKGNCPSLNSLSNCCDGTVDKRICQNLLQG